MRQRRPSGSERANSTVIERGHPGKTVGLFRRLAALAYDGLLLAAVLFVTTFLLLLWRGGQAFNPHDPLYTACLILTGGFFFGWFWTHGGQTLGMRAWKIKLVTVDGHRVGWRHAVVRGLCALLGAACLGLGYLWVCVDPKSRSFQDLASGTRLVRHDRPDQDGA
jgi:uncharacterized RDD family membrane protein YckC